MGTAEDVSLEFLLAKFQVPFHCKQVVKLFKRTDGCI